MVSRILITDDEERIIRNIKVIFDEMEKHLVLQALKKSKNNKTKAAKLLGLSRGTFRYRLGKYNNN
jgi:DNA-binding protein Fis